MYFIFPLVEVTPIFLQALPGLMAAKDEGRYENVDKSRATAIDDFKNFIQILYLLHRKL